MRRSILFIVSVAIVLALGVPALAQKPTVESIVRVIEDPDTSAAERKRAINQLYYYGEKSKPAVPALEIVLKSKAAAADGELVIQVYKTLGAIGKAAVPLLLEGFKQPDPCPGLAVNELTQMNPTNIDGKEVAPVLIAFLDKHREKPRAGGEEALRLLVRLKPDVKDGLPLYTTLAKDGLSPELLKSRRVNETARWRLNIALVAIQGIGSYGAEAKEAVPLLIDLVKTSEEQSLHRQAAIIALGKIGKDAEAALPLLRGLLDTAYGDDASRAIKAIRAEPPPKK